MPNISKLDTEKNAFLIMDQDWDENAMQTMIKEQLVEAQKNIVRMAAQRMWQIRQN